MIVLKIEQVKFAHQSQGLRFKSYGCVSNTI